MEFCLEPIEFILMLLAAIGMTHILVDGYIFQSFRNWLAAKQYRWFVELFSCYQCSGWWSGVFIAGLYLLSYYFPCFAPVKFIFYFACATSFLATLAAVVIAYFNTNASGHE